jgi:uncharacterized protein (DUF1499 family)
MNSESTGRSRNGSGNTIVVAIGVIALVAGLITGGIALGAAVGIWAGIWDFRRGFELLFAEGTGTTNWAHIVAIACLLDAAAIFVLVKTLHATNGARMGILALVGAAVAFMAYSVPNSYRPSPDANIPPIHDISTDTQDPPVFVAVLPIRAGAANTADYGRSEGITPEELRQHTADAYPDLVPINLTESPADAYSRALAAVNSLGWEIVAEAPSEGRIEATDTTFWFRFKDDVVIRIRPAGGGSVVDARSVSRVGRGDAGTNARRLRAFFEQL